MLPATANKQGALHSYRTPLSLAIYNLQFIIFKIPSLPLLDLRSSIPTSIPIPILIPIPAAPSGAPSHKPHSAGRFLHSAPTVEMTMWRPDPNPDPGPGRAVRRSRPCCPADWYLPAFHSLIILTKILRSAQDDSGRLGSPIPIPTSIPVPAAPSGASHQCHCQKSCQSQGSISLPSKFSSVFSAPLWRTLRRISLPSLRLSSSLPIDSPIS